MGRGRGFKEKEGDQGLGRNGGWGGVSEQHSEFSPEDCTFTQGGRLRGPQGMQRASHPCFLLAPGPWQRPAAPPLLSNWEALRKAASVSL